MTVGNDCAFELDMATEKLGQKAIMVSSTWHQIYRCMIHVKDQ